MILNKKIPLENIDFDLDEVWGLRVKYGLLSGRVINPFNRPEELYPKVDKLLAVVCVEHLDQDSIIDITDLLLQDKYDHLLADLKMVIWDELMPSHSGDLDNWELWERYENL